MHITSKFSLFISKIFVQCLVNIIPSDKSSNGYITQNRFLGHRPPGSRVFVLTRSLCGLCFHCLKPQHTKSILGHSSGFTLSNAHQILIATRNAKYSITFGVHFMHFNNEMLTFCNKNPKVHTHAHGSSVMKSIFCIMLNLEVG